MVGGGGTEGVAPEAVVGDAGVGFRGGGVEGELEAVGEGGAGAGGLVGGDGGARDALLDYGPVAEVGAAVVFEGAVVDHLGVEAAVVGVVDFFRHQAVEGGAGCGGGVSGIDGEGGGLLGGREGGGNEGGG